MYSHTLSVEIFFIYHFNNFHHLLALQIMALLSTGNCRCNEYELAAKRRLQVLSQPISETIEEKVKEVEVSCHGSHVKVISTVINTNCTLPHSWGNMASVMCCKAEFNLRVMFLDFPNPVQKILATKTGWLCATQCGKCCSHVLIHEMLCMLDKFLLCGVVCKICCIAQHSSCSVFCFRKSGDGSCLRRTAR